MWTGGGCALTPARASADSGRAGPPASSALIGSPAALLAVWRCQWRPEVSS